MRAARAALWGKAEPGGFVGVRGGVEVAMGGLEVAVDEGCGALAGEGLDEEDEGGEGGALGPEGEGGGELLRPGEGDGRKAVEDDGEGHDGEDREGEVFGAEGEGADLIEDGERFGDGGSAEEDPGEADEVEGEERAEDLAGEACLTTGWHFAAGAIPLPKEDGGETEAVEGSPDEERPGDAVPEAAEQEGDEEGGAIAEAEPLATLGDGIEDVVGEPGGEGDVPALPEVLEVEGEVRTAEVLRQFDAEEEGDAEGEVGVAGEVEEELEGVTVDADEVLEAAVEGGGVEDAG